ncbi:MAG: AAA family ATPase [Nitrospirae bacterium]|nr:AAA family ATPase [Nitrospirota bacterium]
MGLKKIHIQGFKSIRDQELEFGPLNVFIGGNGVGKSNLVGVFHFLNQVSRQSLQTYTGVVGGANALLHFGRKNTKKLTLETEFQAGAKDVNIYKFSLIPTDEDRFVFENELTFYWNKVQYPASPYNDEVWQGHTEAHVRESNRRVAKHIQNHLDSYRIYHFHDTSSSATVKQTGDVNDNRIFRPDAGNLAAFLYMLQQARPGYFENIEDTIRQAAPFFGRFTLEPLALNPDKIRLEWQEKDSDTTFGPSALSDGTLRFMCLATLLLQPSLPSLILIDEPELGLHPAAIQILAGLLQSVATRTQLIVATQSVTLINQLLPEHVWVVDREDGQSVFKNLKSADMTSWLEDYSLGELWEKNIIGGRP